MGVGALKKGYIKNKTTGEVRSFLFNPSTITDSRQINFSELSAPGGSYPSFTYVNSGARNLSVDLFLCDTLTTTTKSYLDFLEGFLPNSAKFTKPPVLIFAMGSDVRECIMPSLTRSFIEYNTNLEVTMANVTLTLIQLKI